MEMLQETHLHALPLTNTDKVANQESEHHNDLLNKIFAWTGATTIGLALTPLALKGLGIGLEHQKLSGACCSIIAQQSKSSILDIEGLYQPLKPDVPSQNVYGIAGALSGAFSHIPFGEPMLELEKKINERMKHVPFVKDHVMDLDETVHPLARGGIMNMLVGGGLIILGHYGGTALENIEKNYVLDKAKKQGFSEEELENIASEAGGISRFIKGATQAAGFTFMMPAILPGVGHSLLFLSSTLGIDKIHYDGKQLENGSYDGVAYGEGLFSGVAAVLGKNPGACKQDTKLADAAEGVASLLASQLCCTVPALVASIPMLISHASSPEQKLPDGVNPYNKKDHELMPDIDKLSKLSDSEIEQRIRDNKFHIADTEQSLKRTSGLRTTLKIGSGVGAAVGTKLLADKIFNPDPTGNSEKLDSAVNKLDGVINKEVSFKDDENHVLLDLADNNRNMGVIRFEASHDNPVKKPDYLKTVRNSLCCNVVLVSRDLLNEPWKELQKILGDVSGVGNIAKQQSLTTGAMAASGGVAAYKLVEHLIDEPYHQKIHSLKHENIVLNSIKAGRGNAKLNGRIASEPEVQKAI
jgi:hypothetical protein